MFCDLFSLNYTFFHEFVNNWQFCLDLSNLQVVSNYGLCWNYYLEFVDFDIWKDSFLQPNKISSDFDPWVNSFDSIWRMKTVLLPFPQWMAHFLPIEWNAIQVLQFFLLFQSTKKKVEEEIPNQFSEKN